MVSSSRRRPRRALGFTLLEMLVVMVIIGLLAGLVGPRMFGKVDTSKVQTAQTQIKMLRSAVGILQLDIGIAPPQDQGLKWLVEPPQEESLKALWKGPYIDGKLPLDPWSNPYVYRSPGLNGQPFSIISYGLDGKEGGEGLAADITN
ncbi:type II secretion system major pseudopilin GspG [Piscinibacter sakaiensis]|uniref:Type II secretion system core protein G n=1 Tax=Piscinibacter sakaiensis TaxID=1547922 RepID=A0A0K8NUC2_PISS1|nr:type II secretion system major pseudopilin GspG [Piscinibacter sakaiensis]GAP33869.1 general secretion pathway protein G [Piscinibacter sakaiensis]